MDAALRNWLAFADDKIAASSTLKIAFNEGRQAATAELSANTRAQASRRASSREHDAADAARLAALTPVHDVRNSPFAIRQSIQRARIKQPKKPTTTNNTNPQTPEIRRARARFK